MGEWSFLTNHARALACIAHDPGVRIRDIAAALGITERNAFGIVADLTTAGYVLKDKEGRRNRYRIQVHVPLRRDDARLPNIPVVFHKTEKLLVALLESAAQAILVIDRGGRIVLANRRAGEMFGYAGDELTGARIELLVPESSRGTHCRQRDDYFQRPRARPMGIGLDLSGRRKDGAEFPVEVSLSTVETEEGIFGIAFVSDISVRKALEGQLVHAQKMEAVGRLAGGVAHDFNNMLTVIAGYNRMILDELSTMDPLRGYAEEILKAADRAASLTNKLLAF